VELKWPWGIVIGAELVCQRVAKARLFGIAEQLRKVRTLWSSIYHPLIHDLFSAMARFLSGPPGGRTLTRTPTRLSDLMGGVFGPGASVASSGSNGQRPAIKAGIARAAGETWEDVIDYYMVRYLTVLISLRTSLS